MNLTFTESRCTSEDGAVWLCLKVTDAAAARRFCFEHDTGLMDCEIKKHREKRSGEANRYMWKLLEELAQALRTSKDELYLQYIQKYGMYREYEFTEDQSKTFAHVWSAQGEGWPLVKVDYAEDGDRAIYHAYYGSSCYSTKTMARLIDQIVEDCKEMGIETLPPDKLESMKREWKPCIK